MSYRDGATGNKTETARQGSPGSEDSSAVETRIARESGSNLTPIVSLSPPPFQDTLQNPAAVGRIDCLLHRV